MSTIDNIPPEKRRGNPAWVKGGGSPNPGGRPKALREIEAMLDSEHRTVENMRETYRRLKELAFAGERDGFFKLYLERLQGPVREIEIDLDDAPQEVIDYLAKLRIS